MRLLLVALVLGSLPAVAHAGGGALIPPTRLDVSPVTMVKADSVTSGFHMTVGLHWASLSPSRSNPVDVGFGYILEQYPDHGARLPPSAECRGDLVHTPWSMHGAYFELDRRLYGNRWQRTWLGVRGELLYAMVNGEHRAGAGLSARMAWELFATTKAGGHNAAIIGTVAVGFFLEVAQRRLPSGINATSTSAGLSLRLPFLVAAN